MATKPIVLLVPCLFVFLAGRVEAAVVGIVDNLPGAFIDISNTGQRLNLTDDATINIFSPVGNAVLPAGQIEIGNNGGVGFGTIGAGLDPGNAPIPSNFAFLGGQALLPFWDDIDDDPIEKMFDVYFWVQSGVAIVQWENLPLKDMLLANGGESATIGYQDGGAGNNDVQWSSNTAGAVSNGTVLSLVESTPRGPPTVFAQFLYEEIEASNRVRFQIQYAPEPSTALLVLVGLPLILRKRSRRLY